MPDFTQPGSDGIPIEGANEFQRGLIYTVDPRVTRPLDRRTDYRIVASTRFWIPKDVEFSGYEHLYRRARRLLDRRRSELSCADAANDLRTWIVSHGWFRMEISSGALAGAVVTLGAACSSGEDAPRGQDEPTSESLTTPYVEQLGAKDATSFDEFYNDFDMRSDRTQPSILTVSYGEYVPSRDGLDYSGLVERADDRARAYIEVVAGPGEELSVSHRDWTCLDTGKTSKPHLGFVSLLFRPR